MMIETERLITRRFCGEDWEDLYAYLSDPGVVRFEPYAPFHAEQCKQEAQRREDDEDFWAVCLKENGRLIGNLYFSRQADDTWELGFVFNAAYQGKGYAMESARALLDRAFSEWAAQRVIAQCNPENKKSWRLLERLGMRRERHLIQNVSFHKDVSGNPIYVDTYEYELLWGEWEPNRMNS